MFRLRGHRRRQSVLQKVRYCAQKIRHFRQGVLTAAFRRSNFRSRQADEPAMRRPRRPAIDLRIADQKRILQNQFVIPLRFP
jgi:hypothetical protein